VHYLLLHVLALVAFGQSLRWGQRRTDSIIGISTVNYAVAALLSAGGLGLVLLQHSITAEARTLALLGGANGVLYFLNLLLMLAGYELAGVGITSAVISCGCLVPILFAWLVDWEERLLPSQWGAVALLPIAIFLMRPRPQLARPFGLKTDLVLLAAFLAPGTSATVHTAAARAGADHLPGQAIYATAIFVLALLCTAAYARVRRERIDRARTAAGAGIGVLNILATVMLVCAVKALGVAVFFPTASSAVILLHLLVSGALWGERPTRRQFAGVAVAILVLVLANLER